MDDFTELFCKIDDFCKKFEPEMYSVNDLVEIDNNIAENALRVVSLGAVDNSHR